MNLHRLFRLETSGIWAGEGAQWLRAPAPGFSLSTHMAADRNKCGFLLLLFF